MTDTLKPVRIPEALIVRLDSVFPDRLTALPANASVEYLRVRQGQRDVVEYIKTMQQEYEDYVAEKDRESTSQLSFLPDD